ncbi:TetR/AcrR family transcriptional regulator [candidate division KSB1 bacterium]|nr:TetR/AcrR family transcriptional regulator [candidate division KSB1 bacterium]
MAKSDKKQMILKAAADCFSRYGYEKTTLDEIGRQVGLTKTSIYYYYANKESIFTEVIYLEMDEFLNNLHKRIDKVPNCRDKILIYLREKILYMQQLFYLHNLSIETIAHVQPFFVDLFKSVLKKEVNFLNEILIYCQKDCMNREYDTKRVAYNILNILDALRLGALLEQNFRFPPHIDYKKIEEEVIFTVSLILDGLQAPPKKLE